MDKSYFDVKPKGRHAQAIAKPTADALMEFCRQEPEFEQAIVQSGKSFEDCLQAITKNIGNAISDLEVYSRAVKFYFPVAAVRFRMSIDICGDNGAVDPPITMTKQDKLDQMQLSLDALLNF
ncbi:MAG: PcfK-like family protein [Oscillospiraceae bacterium]|nr:PcfK-like family protein [Oscillospiraceae bacterium]